jgi:hypothetical protein
MQYFALRDETGPVSGRDPLPESGLKAVHLMARERAVGGNADDE